MTGFAVQNERTNSMPSPVRAPRAAMGTSHASKSDWYSPQTPTPTVRRPLEAAFASRSVTEWRKPLDDARIPWGPYQRIDELLVDPAVIANGYIGTVERAGGSSPSR